MCVFEGVSVSRSMFCVRVRVSKCEDATSVYVCANLLECRSVDL